ncbi:ATP synthase subunit I [Saccharibacillus endophyticus]|uniref:ATP synthase subunit I n=1 Tax=Saccharibacillus endophyticus TaxID=2060666 RepID=A0ABQ2A8F5_9BACL|nr:ATP synthase subunit I [Saccharibacillus endophyticus]GGH86838.1 hypothetical protein GCM10007362_47550 [Saccharibacillus endophyticus]
MNELTRYMRWLTRITYVLLAIGAVWMLIAPHHHPVLMGLILGLSISCLSSYFLLYKVRRMTDAAAEGRRVRGGIGFVWRALAAVGGIVVAIEFPREINLQALLASMVAAPFILLIVGIFINRKESQAEMARFAERREEVEQLTGERGEKDA